MTAISLDNVSFWAPSALQGAKDPSRRQQRHPDPSFSPELPLLPTQEQFEEPWTQSGHTQNDPISILSDADSEVSAAERRYPNEDDGEDSDSTLPSINSIVASLAEVRPGKSSRTATSAWPDEAQLARLDVVRQESPCEMDRIVAGDMPGCQGVGLGAPTPEIQPNSVMMDNQHVPASQHISHTSDAVLANDRGHNVQSPSDYPSTCAHPPRSASPAEAVQASVQESEILPGESCDNAIPAALTPSPTPPSPKPYEGEGLDDATCASVRVTPDVIGAGSGAGTKVPSPSTSPRRFRRDSQQTSETTQSKDSDTDNQSSGTKDRLERLECQHGEISHLQPASEDASSDDDDAHQSRKRRRVTKSPSCAVRSTLDSSRCSRGSRHRRSAARLSTASRTPGYNVNRSPSSEANPACSEAGVLLAQFEQWPLRDVFLKRITEGSKTTFQLQFEWDTESCDPRSDKSVSQSEKGGEMKNLDSAAKSSGKRWTLKEDETVRRMRQAGRSWSDIQRALPHRSEGTIQVRYSTKLKG
ncbi:hypothetical protein FPRO05_06153 [Fusarium proliferatum]|uniref:Myb-like domain-containing protein n=1 Tax=Gibberella intermedia TaxID=948311 RepID=A0A365MNY6_GIBIN|nr:hypothetical protein FPRO05_06153 [Fusarium proliferatum]